MHDLAVLDAHRHALEMLPVARARDALAGVGDEQRSVQRALELVLGDQAASGAVVERRQHIASGASCCEYCIRESGIGNRESFANNQHVTTKAAK